MSTKVFISWSGDLSRQLACALSEWLPSTLQYVKPFFSPDDIEKGARWDAEISKELQSSNIGIICLTKDNLEKPWIIFESGALSKSLERSYVCPLIFEMDQADLKGPLTTFQTTKFEKNEIKKLLITINNVAGENKLEVNVLENVFEMWWPKLESKVTEILTSQVKPLKLKQRQDREILEEILDLTRMTAVRITSEKSIIMQRKTADSVPALISSIERFIRSVYSSGEIIDKTWVIPLDNALEQVCMELGMLEYYRKFHMHIFSSYVVGTGLDEESNDLTNLKIGRPLIGNLDNTKNKKRL